MMVVQKMIYLSDSDELSAGKSSHDTQDIFEQRHVNVGIYGPGGDEVWKGVDTDQFQVACFGQQCVECEHCKCAVGAFSLDLIQEGAYLGR
jgi:hypothetical protein